MPTSDQTAIRHKLLENGYTPLANVDKRCMLKGWPSLEVDHDTIEEWADRRGLRATGLRMEKDLIALDFDIDDADALDAIWDAVEVADPVLFKTLESLPMRGGKGEKICLFARLDTGKIDKLWSKAYYKPGAREADPTGAVLHRLEVFTGSGEAGARQIGVYGAHTVDQGEVLVEYRWADGIGLCDVPYSDLPRLRRKDVFTIVDTVSRVLDKLGWDFEVSAKHGKVSDTRSLTLLPTMRFNTNRDENLSLEDLEASAAVDEGLRVSLSFVERGAQNCTRGLVGINPQDDRVQVWDSATATLYRPADISLSAKISGIGEGLKRLGLVRDKVALGTRLGAAPGETMDTCAEAVDAEDKTDRVGVKDSGVETAPKSGSSGGAGDADDEEEIAVGSDGRCMVPVGEGDLTDATWLTARWLAGQDDLYRRAGRVSRVVGGDMVLMTDPRLSVEIGEKVMCIREERAGSSVRLVEVDPPVGLVRQVAAVVDEVGFRELRGVVDVPVVRADGSLLMEDGWDAASKLLVQVGDRFAGAVPDEVSREQADAAVDVLMRPFRAFPLVGSESRGALLAALLTAVVRPGLPTAPAFALDAPAAGSGKTLLASCIMALGGGGKLYAPLPVKDESEVAKVLLSVLVEKPRVVLFDNQVGLIDSASLAAVLTAPTYSGRILGSTRTVQLDTNSMFMFSGNNIAMIGDMTRRVLTIRINAECEAPAMRAFDFDPLSEVMTSRHKMVAAALTLIRWAMSQRGESARGRVGSFEVWDVLVGQTVAALQRDDLADPARLIEESQTQDPRGEELAILLTGLRGMFGSTWFRAADVAEAISVRTTHSGGVASVLEDALSKSMSAVGIGRYLRFRRDSRVGDLKLLMRPSTNKSNPTLYRVAADDESSVVKFETWQEKRKATKTKIDHLKT